MPKSTPLGLFAGLALIYGAIFMGDGWQTFFDGGSFVIVLGGTMAALVVGFSFEEVRAVPAGMKAFFRFREPDLSERVTLLVDLSRTARRDGLLALDRQLHRADDELMKLGLEMAIDGVEGEEIDGMLRTRIEAGARRRRLIGRFFDTAGTYAPAFGMIGTLIGLIRMLQNLNDPSAIGPAMAVAMITTFYGALLANLIFLPIATKAKEQNRIQVKVDQMTRAGVLGIVNGDSPLMLEKRLNPYLDDAPAAGATEPRPVLSRAA